MERFGLRDDQWDRIKNILPSREGHVGGTAPDNVMIAGLVHEGLATAHREIVTVSQRGTIEVVRIRITEAARMALEG